MCARKKSRVTLEALWTVFRIGSERFPLFLHQKEFWIVISSAVRASPLSCDLLSKGKKDMRETLSEYSLYYCLSFTRYLQYAEVLSFAFNDSMLPFYVGRVSRKYVAKYFPCIICDGMRFQHFLQNQMYFPRQTWFFCTKENKIFIARFIEEILKSDDITIESVF